MFFKLKQEHIQYITKQRTHSIIYNNVRLIIKSVVYEHVIIL